MSLVLNSFDLKILHNHPYSCVVTNTMRPPYNMFYCILSYYRQCHYSDVIMSGIASQNTSLTIVYSTVYSDADQRRHQSSASLAFVRGTHRGPVNSPHKWPVTRKMFPFDDVIMAGYGIYREITRNTPYLTGKLWSVISEHLKET